MTGTNHQRKNCIFCDRFRVLIVTYAENFIWLRRTWRQHFEPHAESTLWGCIKATIALLFDRYDEKSSYDAIVETVAYGPSYSVWNDACSNPIEWEACDLMKGFRYRIYTDGNC